MADTQFEILCPACGKPMTKLFIAEKGINIDVCENGCGGMFFDARELQEFSGYDDDISELKKILEGKNFMPVDETKTRICPSCAHNMVKTKVFGIEIDTCYTCGGLFLDYGEFEKVRVNFKKTKKVEQIQFDNPDSDIVLKVFYDYKQAQELHPDMSISDFKRNLRRSSRLLYSIFRLFH